MVYKKSNNMVQLISMYVKLQWKKDKNFYEQVECDGIGQEISQKLNTNISKFHDSISHKVHFKISPFFLENPKISIAILGIGTSILLGGTKKLNYIRRNRVKTKNGKILSSKIEKKKKKHRTLKKTLHERECGRCGLLKPKRDFYLTKDSYGKTVRTSLCKSCRNIRGNIAKSIKKIKCILTCFHQPCNNCEIDDAFIPVFNFHHKNPKIKKESWAKINSKSIDYILDWIQREQIVSLCNNCHNQIQSKHLNQKLTRDKILDPELFSKSSTEIRHIVKKITSNITNSASRGGRRGKILEWIKKRYVIKNLIGNYCPGCGLSVLDHLGAFEMHHLNPELKNNKWDKIEYKTIPQILHTLVDEQCMWLCSNCHSLITSDFEQRAKENFEMIYSPEKVARKLKILEERYSKINIAIKNYKPNLDKIDYDPLFYIHQDNRWKYYFIRLHELYPISFQTKYFRDMLSEHYKFHMIKYKNLGLVEHVYSDYKRRGYYKYTDKGLNMIPQFQYDIDMNLIDRRKKK
ncbi:MAG: hypothetical protein ACTSPA_01400 [Promethearchaeota archaeon]